MPYCVCGSSLSGLVLGVLFDSLGVRCKFAYILTHSDLVEPILARHTGSQQLFISRLPSILI